MRRVDAGPVQQLGGGAGARHPVDREVLEVQIGERLGGQRREHRRAQTALGMVILGHHHAPPGLGDGRTDALRIDRLEVGPAVTGVARVGKLQGRADIRSGRALVDLAARIDGSDLLRVHLDAEPDRDRFEVATRAIGRAVPGASVRVHRASADAYLRSANGVFYLVFLYPPYDVGETELSDI